VVLWFAGLSWLLVWRVFRSPNIDYRLVILGALLPCVDDLIGRPTPLHTLVGAVVAFAAVAAFTRKRRLASRQWVGIPIGMFFHLVLDGTWSETELFWWPFTGGVLADMTVPELGWPVPVVVGAEVIGALVIAGLWIRLGLTDADRRRAFIRSGHLDRELA
jgi:hypothetical protein